MNQQFFMLSDAGIKVLTEQITENILSAISENKKSTMEDFLSIDQASKIVNLSKATIYGLTHKNAIPFYKNGKRLHFLKSELLTWVKNGNKHSISEQQQKANDYLFKNRMQ